MTLSQVYTGTYVEGNRAATMDAVVAMAQVDNPGMTLELADAAAEEPMSDGVTYTYSVQFVLTPIGP